MNDDTPIHTPKLTRTKRGEFWADKSGDFARVYDHTDKLVASIHRDFIHLFVGRITRWEI